jgi:hypothetical protein
MSKVFNKIRYALLSDNKTGKYLKYAIGEIILVVIGILIALQINTWNEERKTAIEEGLYLNRLLAENKEDLESFSIEIKNLEKGIETILTFSEALKTLNPLDTLLVKAANGYFQFGSIYPTFTSSSSTFDDLSSTGNLKVISNSSLRDKLVKHYALHKQTAERIRVGIEWALPVDGAFTYEHSIMRFEPSSTFLFPQSSMEDLALDLKDNRLDFINVAAAQYWLKNDAITQLKALSNETKDVIEHLENEIAK